MLDKTDGLIPASTWTDERVELLKRLYEEGLSAGRIAAEMDLTRNAAIGKCQRLGFVGRPSTDKAPSWVRSASRAGGARRGDGGLVEKIRAAARNRKALLSTPDRRGAPQLAERKIPAPAIDLQQFNDAIPLEQRCGLLELDNTKCHFPIGDPCDPGFFFCGADTDGATYCPFHAYICFAPPTARRDRQRAA